ncbi:hypothetical protein D3C71_2206860 [compost metagenome]
MLLSSLQIDVGTICCVTVAHVLVHRNTDASQLIYHIAEALEVQYRHIVNFQAHVLADHLLHFFLSIYT